MTPTTTRSPTTSARPSSGDPELEAEDQRVLSEQRLKLDEGWGRRRCQQDPKVLTTEWLWWDLPE